MGCSQSKSTVSFDGRADFYDPVVLKGKNDAFDLTQHEIRISHRSMPQSKSNFEIQNSICALNAAESIESLISMMDKINNFHLESVTEKLSKSVFNYAGICKTGYAATNPAKVNQDRILMFRDEFTPENGGDCVETFVFGCLDGHGEFGAEVAAHFQNGLTTLLPQHPLYQGSIEAIKHAITETILTLEVQLGQLQDVDASMSGCTLVLVVVRDGTLLTANVGDSRAVLVRSARDVSMDFVVSGTHSSTHNNSHNTSNSNSHSRGSKGNGVQGMLTTQKEKEKALVPPTVLALSRDHKADLADEHARILAAGGRVMCREFADGSRGPVRVYLGSDDVPGLAMSRSLGDRTVHSVGVISTPEFSVQPVEAHDLFVVLASDGLWDYVSSEEVAMVVRRNDIAGSVKELIALSHGRWISKVGVAVDDTSIIVVQLAAHVDDRTLRV